MKSRRSTVLMGALLGIVLILLLIVFVDEPSLPDRAARLASRQSPTIGTSDPTIVESLQPAGTVVRADGNGTDFVHIRVRDLADGQSVPTLRLIACHKTALEDTLAAVESYVTDSSGSVAILRSDLNGIACASKGYVFPTEQAHLAVKTGDLWCYRRFVVEGIVSREGGVAPRVDEVRLDALFMFRSKLGVFSKALPPPPWTRTWFREHGLSQRVPIGTSDPSMRFRLMVPRIRYLGIRATSRDGASGFVTVELDSLQDYAWVAITLKDRCRVTGRLLGPDSQPLKKVETVLLCERRMPRSSVDLRSLRASGDGVCSIGRRGEDSRVWVFRGRNTGKDGTIDVSVGSPGKGLLVAFVPGCAPVRVHLGQMAGGHVDVGTIQATSRSGVPRVKFLYRGKALLNHHTIIADVSSEVGQVGLPIHQLDHEGSAPGEWLENGRMYFICLSGPLLPRGYTNGSFRWSGQCEIDVEEDLKPL